MKTQVTQLEDNLVRLEVQVSEDELATSLDAAARALSRSVNLKGFRRGKVPRKVLERHIGREPILEEALRHAIPSSLAEAIEAEDIDVVGRPEIEDVSAGMDEPLQFSAKLAVRPRIDVGDLSDLEVTLTSGLEPSDNEVDEQIDELRSRFATSATVSRPARDEDFCLINVDAHVHSEKIDDLCRQDFLYEVGSGGLLPEFDEKLVGARAGEIVKFNAPIPEGVPVHGGNEVACAVLVKEVREKVLPDVSDEWVQEASEFETLDELRDEVRARLRRVKRMQVLDEARGKVIEALVDRAGLRVPEALVEEELDARVHDFGHRIAGSDLDLEEFLSQRGETVDSFRAQLEPAARHGVEASLVLRAVAEAAGLEATPAEVDERVAAFAEQADRPPARVRRELTERGALPSLAAGIIRAKALRHLLDRVTIVDAAGGVVDFEATEVDDLDVADDETTEAGDGAPEVEEDPEEDPQAEG